MQNPTVSDPQTLIELCEDIVIRYVTQDERHARLLAFVQFVKFECRWRVLIFSEQSCTRLWDKLRDMHPDSLEDLISLTNEFAFRSNRFFKKNALNNDIVLSDLADSICWMKGSAAVDTDSQKFTATSEDYLDVLTKNKWVVFLYLLSMSDIVSKLLNHTPKES